MLPSAREQRPARFVTPSQFNMPPTAYPLTERPTSLPPILAINQSNIIAISAPSNPHSSVFIQIPRYVSSYRRRSCPCLVLGKIPVSPGTSSRNNYKYGHFDFYEPRLGVVHRTARICIANTAITMKDNFWFPGSWIACISRAAEGAWIPIP